MWYREKEDLREEGGGGLFVGDGACDGDEFAFFNFFFETHSLFDGGVSACIIITAAAAAASSEDHGSLDTGDGEK